MTDITGPRWYCVSRDGLVTLCAGQQDATESAASFDVDWPHSAPHRAVRLIDAETACADTEQAVRQALDAREFIHAESSRIYSRLAVAVQSGADDATLGAMLRAEVAARRAKITP